MKKDSDLLPNVIFVLYLSFHDNRQADELNANTPITGYGRCL